jgi:hypothetical protein
LTTNDSPGGSLDGRQQHAVGLVTGKAMGTAIHRVGAIVAWRAGLGNFPGNPPRGVTSERAASCVTESALAGHGWTWCGGRAGGSIRPAAHGENGGWRVYSASGRRDALPGTFGRGETWRLVRNNQCVSPTLLKFSRINVEIIVFDGLAKYKGSLEFLADSVGAGCRLCGLVGKRVQDATGLVVFIWEDARKMSGSEAADRTAPISSVPIFRLDDVSLFETSRSLATVQGYGRRYFPPPL